ncbi:MAG: hypothetical protein CBC35_03385 [Planctomycetes bacterium TMED75]|nr:hypothetical protein [Planctomycetaceae bacterium]OUU94757.1 MAG: hypothetical protein CBC35_03385 [Planctomycetes bacterium TMED75]
MDALPAEIILLTAASYLALGLVFAVGFSWRGWRAIEKSDAGGTLVFKIMLIPGASLLWPLLLRRWIQANRSNSKSEHRE